ncbi:DnaJ subfamily B member 2 [Phytophthora nicotianae]|uniref:DnaJ subfamily B member 2 n=1 Tax=Phytophthora nicotianae TaxID=4792 RepID=A0A0W8DL44_PHYNI|nr:DnaJ subfamily B member 2 [Phytophthora nicotianae]
MQIHLKREVPTINNYSPVLLSSWRANVDIQLIGNAYGAAEYTAAYVSKADPDTLRFRQVITRAVKRCDPNLPNYAILKRVANATLSIREVSAQETYYILLRELPLYGKSRQVTQVKTMRHSLRYFRVDGSELFDIEESVNRNDSIHIARKAHVVRGTLWIAPDSTNANFCFAEIFLHKPWRTLEELPQTDDECIETFEQEQQNVLESELRHESSLKISRQAELDALKKSRATQVHTTLPSSEYVFVGDGPEDESYLVAPGDDNTNETCTSTNDSSLFQWTAKRSYTSEDVTKAKTFVKTHVKPWIKLQKEIRRARESTAYSEPNGSCYQYPIIDVNSNVQIAVMDESQWVPFAFVMVQSRARLQASVNSTTCEPMQ